MVLNCDWHELLGYLVVSVDGCSVYSERCYVWHWHSWTVKARRAVAKYWYLLNEIRPVPEFSLQNLAVSVLLRRTLCFYMNVFLFKARCSRLRVSQHCAAHCTALRASINVKNPGYAVCFESRDLRHAESERHYEEFQLRLGLWSLNTSLCWAAMSGVERRVRVVMWRIRHFPTIFTPHKTLIVPCMTVLRSSFLAGSFLCTSFWSGIMVTK